MSDLCHLQYQLNVYHNAVLILFLSYCGQNPISSVDEPHHENIYALSKNLQLPSYETVEFSICVSVCSDGQAVIHTCMQYEFSDTSFSSLVKVSEKNMKYPVTRTEDIFAG